MANPNEGRSYSTFVWEFRLDNLSGLDYFNAMPSWFSRSVFGAVVAIVYLVVAVVAVVSDRRESGGGWISLRGMGAFLVTFPVSCLGEAIGLKPDYRRNSDMAFAIGVCMVLVYFLGAGIARLARALFGPGGAG